VLSGNWVRHSRSMAERNIDPVEYVAPDRWLKVQMRCAMKAKKGLCGALAIKSVSMPRGLGSNRRLSKASKGRKWRKGRMGRSLKMPPKWCRIK
jgi:hypothetical protein